MASAVPAHAQPAVREAPSPRNYISINPLRLLATSLAIDYERAVGRTTSVGVGVSDFWWSNLFSSSTVHYRYADARVHYYPRRYPRVEVFTGLSLGASLGVARLGGQAWLTGVAVPTMVRRAVHAPVIGGEVAYSWFYDAGRHIGSSVGFGEKCVAGRVTRPPDDALRCWPMFRTNIAVAW